LMEFLSCLYIDLRISINFFFTFFHVYWQYFIGGLLQGKLIGFCAVFLGLFTNVR